MFGLFTYGALYYFDAHICMHVSSLVPWSITLYSFPQRGYAEEASTLVAYTVCVHA